MIKHVHWYSYKVEILYADFHETIIISVGFRRNSNISFNEISQVGAELFDADERTDLKKLIVAFSNFCERANQFHILPTQCIYVSCMDLSTNSCYFLHKGNEWFL